MKKLNLTALLLGAALFTGLGVTSASAEGTKCGAGKCGAAMSKPVKKCGDAKKEASKCGADKKASSKCGASKKEPVKKATMKCGAGKCGSK